MERNYAEVRKDLRSFLHENSMSQGEFCRRYGTSESSLSRFLSGNFKQTGNVMDVAKNVLYSNEKCDEKEYYDEVKEESEIDDSLDAQVMKLIDKRIENTCEKIKKLENDLNKLQESRKIIKELLG